MSDAADAPDASGSTDGVDGDGSNGANRADGSEGGNREPTPPSDDGPMQVSDPNYHSVNHTATQTCGWTKNALKGDGKCYKNIWYGIESHRCIQMTPVVKCNERCVFCWRDHQGHAYELGDVEWDDPAAVADASVELQTKLLSGFGGNDEVPRERFDEAMEPRHVAISLDGEPTLYPYLPELIDEFHARDITTFLVSNGTNPEMLEKCDPTQLYVSVDAADRKTFDDVVRPVDEPCSGRRCWTVRTCIHPTGTPRSTSAPTPTSSN